MRIAKKSFVALGALSVIGAAAVGGCGRSTVSDVAVGAPTATAAQSASSQATNRWLLSADELGQSLGSPSAAATNAAPNGSTGDDTKLPAPKKVPLAADSPLVSALQAKLPKPLPLNYATKSGNTTYVSFGQHGAATVTFTFSQLDKPIAPVLLPDAEFKAMYSQRSDGVEQFIDTRSPSLRISNQKVTKTGKSVAVAAESGKARAQLLLTDAQVESLANDVLGATLPAA